ncbi:MAG: hypothetical protein IT371_27960 [Deltaproteobacteria bacterium]|nr:hypothetical protein [Deltaproteobacteria bacterium]
MIELKDDGLLFTFPEVHPGAELRIELQRTLRIPDDDKAYPLPPGFGPFPMRHVDDFAERVPREWVEHGGVMLPMYQSEALWLHFQGTYLEDHETTYPFAIKVAAGKINAATGDAWSSGLHRDPQDYLYVPGQPWLDGYCVEKGFIRQFVAMPLGAGYTAEEQLTGKAEHGGLQLIVYPMKREVFERRFPKVERKVRERYHEFADMDAMAVPCAAAPSPAMGLAPGGRMRQEIYADVFELADWDAASSRCFVHLANSLVWRGITGENPPTTPPTAKEYARAGLPWFDYYGEGAKAVEGSSLLGKLKSVFALGQEKGAAPLPENESVSPEKVIHLKGKPGQVREGDF